jgi:hypothetical protein
MARDIFDYLSLLGQERYRAIILHAKPEQSPQVTRFSKKVCAQSGGKYLDLLDIFIQNKDLSGQIDVFSPEKFREFIIEHCKGVSLLVIDRVDFLLDTWRRVERQNFFRMLTDQWDSFKEGMNAKLVICLQTSHEIEALRITDSHNQSRIFQLGDFNDIG